MEQAIDQFLVLFVEAEHNDRPSGLIPPRLLP
jgi:hypothetical protein